MACIGLYLLKGRDWSPHISDTWVYVYFCKSARPGSNFRARGSTQAKILCSITKWLFLYNFVSAPSDPNIPTQLVNLTPTWGVNSGFGLTFRTQLVNRWIQIVTILRSTSHELNHCLSQMVLTPCMFKQIDLIFYKQAGYGPYIWIQPSMTQS